MAGLPWQPMLDRLETRPPAQPSFGGCDLMGAMAAATTPLVPPPGPFPEEQPVYKQQLDPVYDPYYNLREVCLECVALEQHLSEPRKRCYDCIGKHFWTIEKLLKESVGIDQVAGFPGDDVMQLANAVKNLRAAAMGGGSPVRISQAIRMMRKGLTPIVNDYEVNGSPAKRMIAPSYQVRQRGVRDGRGIMLQTMEPGERVGLPEHWTIDDALDLMGIDMPPPPPDELAGIELELDFLEAG